MPAITGLKRVSRPGLRRYVAADEIPRVRGGQGIAILSTPRGVLSGREAKRQKCWRRIARVRLLGTFTEKITRMSRIGNRSIQIPDKVKINVAARRRGGG